MEPSADSFRRGRRLLDPIGGHPPHEVHMRRSSLTGAPAGSLRIPFVMASAMISEATPAATPITEIAVITPTTAWRRFARRYLAAINSSNRIGSQLTIHRRHTMRAQYHFRQSPPGPSRLECPPSCRSLFHTAARTRSSFGHPRTRRAYWSGDSTTPITCRQIAEHARLIRDCDLAFPIILSSDGRAWTACIGSAKPSSMVSPR